MEAIIWIILLGLVSSILKNLGNMSKQEKIPERKPVAKKVSKPIEKKETPQRIIKPYTNDMFIKPDAYDIEGEESEAQPEMNVIEPQDQYEVVEEDSGLWGNITMEELQRSIIMAEVLGKPKALRRK